MRGKTWKGRLAVFAVLVLVLAVMAGCSGRSGGSGGSGGSPSSPAASPPPASSQAPAGGGETGQTARPFEGRSITFVIANHPWGEAIKPLLPEFEEATGMTVNVDSFFEDQLTQKLTVQFASGSSTPDVFMYRPLQEGKLFFKNGWLEALDGYVSGSTDYDFADFSKAAVGSTTVDGKLTGIPIITEQEILYYRKDVLAEKGIPVPKTLAELVDAARQLHDPANEFYGFVARGQLSPLVTQVSSFIYSEGGDFITDGKASINTPEALRGMSIYAELLREYGPPGVLNMSWPQAIGVFAQGKVAFYTDASSIYQNATDPEKSNIPDKVGFAMFPAGSAGSRPYNVTSWGLAINAKSQNKDAAWALIEWATSKEIVLKTQKMGNPGARVSVWNNPESTSSYPPELVEVIRESTKGGVDHDRPTVISVGEAREVVGEIVQRMITGASETEIQTIADEANKKLQEIIDRDAQR